MPPSLRTLWAEHRRAVLAVLTVLLALAGGSVAVVVDTDGDPSTPATTYTITERFTAAPVATAIDGPDADVARDDELDVAPATLRALDVAVADQASNDSGDLAGDLRGQDAEPAGVLQGPLAAQEWPGCRTMFVKAFSARTSNIRGIALHYTVGPNLPGWQDLIGLTAYSNNTANQVSWNFAIDREGNCTYNVPTIYKAWTTGNLNSQVVSIEVVGMGTEPDYAGAGFPKLRKVVRRIGRVHGIPMQLGAVSNCVITRPGIIDHNMGGTCAGGHHDINPHKVADVVARIAAAGPTVKKWCRKAHRRLGDGKTQLRRELARRHGYRCRSGKALVAA